MTIKKFYITNYIMQFVVSLVLYGRVSAVTADDGVLHGEVQN